MRNEKGRQETAQEKVANTCSSPLVKRGFLLSYQILTGAFVNAINIRLPDIL